MAQKFLTDIEVTRGLVDSDGDLGVAGQVLSSTGTGTNWITNEANSTVVYLDEFTGDNSTVDFTLSVSVTDENITQVYIDGVYQNKDTYSVSNTTLTFSTAPPLNADIEVITFSTATTSDDLQAGVMIIPVKNTHTASIAKGEPVYITGNVGSSARLQIAPADASNSAKMPAAGLLLQTLAVNAQGYVVTGGYLRNITTDTIDGTSTTSNDTVYVKSGGGLTMTKPTGTNLIQNIAKVARSASGNAGSLIVSSILRTNDVPNITDDYFWLGNSSGVATPTEFTSSVRGLISVSGNALSYNSSTGVITSNYEESPTFTGNVVINGTLELGQADTASGHINAKELMTFNIDTDNDDTNRYFGWYVNGADGSGTELLKILETGAATFAGDITFGATNPFQQSTNVLDGTGADGARIRSAVSSAANPTFSNSDDTNTGMFFAAADTLGFTTAGIERMRIESNGKIDISGYGTEGAYLSSKGSFRIDIDNDNDHTDRAFIVSSNNAASDVLTIEETGLATIKSTTNNSSDLLRLRTSDNFGYNFVRSHTTGFLEISGNQTNANGYVFKTNTTAALTIINNGSVGVGTTSPGEKLDVTGTIRSTAYEGKIKINSTATNGKQYEFISIDTGNLGLYDGTAYRLWIGGTGNLGIGTTSPAVKLDVRGEIAVDYNATYGLRFYNDARNNWSSIGNNITGSSSANLVFKDATGEAMRLEGGHLGIGVANPGNTLHIDSSYTNSVHIQGTGSHSLFSYHDSGGTGWATGSGTSYDNLVYLDAANDKIHFYTAQSNRMTIHSTGVGIGKTSPSQKLDVEGSIRLNSELQIFTGTTDIGQISNSGGALNIQGTSTRDVSLGSDSYPQAVFIEGSNGRIGLGTTAPSSTLHVNGVVTANDSIQVQNNDSGFVCKNTAGTVIGTIGAASSSLPNIGMFTVRDNGNNRIVLHANGSSYFNGGSVGIGTTSPSQNLHVVGSIYSAGVGSALLFDTTGAFSSNGIKTINDYETLIYNGRGSAGFAVIGNSNIRLGFGTNYTNAETDLFISSAGNIGIGTAAPTANLHIRSTGDAIIKLEADTDNVTESDNPEIHFTQDGGATEMRIGLAATNNEAYFWQYQANDIKFGTNNTERWRIESDGDILHTDGNLTMSGGTPFIVLSNTAETESGITFVDSADSGQSAKITYDAGSSNLLKFYNNSTNTRMVINNSGNVGINTTTPADKLQIDGPNSQLRLRDTDDGTYTQFSSSGNLLAIRQNSTTASHFWMNSSGYVGLGTNNPTAPLQVHGQQKWYTTNADGNELRGFFNPGGAADDAELSLYIADGASEGIVWRAAGNSYVRVDSTSLKFLNFYYGGSNVGAIVTGGSNVLYQSFSDYRLKENVQNLTGALDKVNNLQPKTFNYISTPEITNEGFLAHELQEIVPQAVSGIKDEVDEDGNPRYQGVDNAHIVPLLVGAIKELKQEIETLKLQING